GCTRLQQLLFDGSTPSATVECQASEMIVASQCISHIAVNVIITHRPWINYDHRDGPLQENSEWGVLKMVVYQESNTFLWAFKMTPKIAAPRNLQPPGTCSPLGA
ncbi:unnamed protein product, partial [Pleuronectes platessa]